MAGTIEPYIRFWWAIRMGGGQLGNLELDELIMYRETFRRWASWKRMEYVA
jgi:hypothetical protein